MQNHFDLFQIEAKYNIDLAQLDSAFRAVQAKVHPDNFVRASDVEKRVAMQWSTQANEAYQTLKKPLQRASYLCHLQGIDLQTESNTSMPSHFLMQQMEWREEFEDAHNSKNLSIMYALEANVKAAFKAQLTEVGESLDAHLFTQAASQIRCCLFLEKFLKDISNNIANLEDS